MVFSFMILSREMTTLHFGGITVELIEGLSKKEIKIIFKLFHLSSSLAY